MNESEWLHFCQLTNRIQDIYALLRETNEDLQDALQEYKSFVAKYPVIARCGKTVHLLNQAPCCGGESAVTGKRPDVVASAP